MTEQENSGLRLVPAAGKRDRGIPAMLAWLALFLPVFGSFGCLLEAALGISARNGWLWFAVGGGLALAFRLIAERFRLPQWPAWLVLTMLLPVEMLAGFPKLYNHARPIWMGAAGRIFLELQEGESAGLHAAALLVVAGALLALLSLLLTEKAPKTGAALLLLCSLAAAAFFRENGAVLALPVLSAVLLAAAGVSGLGRDRWKMAALRAVSCALIAAVLLALVPFAAGNGLAALRVQTEDALHRLRYGSGVLPEGRLDRGPNATDDVQLRVTMEAPETLYLRGFVGDVLEGNRWRALPYEALTEDSDLIFWLQRDLFYPQTQFAAAMKTQPQALQQNRITVENLHAGRAYLFVPCGLSGVETGGSLPRQRLDCGAIPGNNSKSYTYTAVYEPAEQVSALLTGLRELPAGAKAFLAGEGGYRTAVERYALEVPEAALEPLQAQLDALCAPYGGREKLTEGQAQDCARAFLQKIPGETSFEKATAAVLALRYFDIPARYAEGFVISKEAAERADGAAVELGAANALAWPEIYLDGAGWMPVSQTPGYRTPSGADPESGEDPFGTGGSDADPETIPQGQELEDPAEDDEDDEGEQPEAQPQTELPPQRALWIALLCVLAALLLAMLLLALRRRRILRARQAKFDDADPGKAVGWLYSDSAKLLSLLGLRRGTGSMEPVCRMAEERFGADYGKQCREATRLNSEALFSSHALSENARETEKAFREETLRLLQNSQTALQRLHSRWISCIY